MTARRGFHADVDRRPLTWLPPTGDHGEPETVRWAYDAQLSESTPSARRVPRRVRGTGART